MATLMTGYQREMLERKRAFGIVAVRQDDSWHCYIYSDNGFERVINEWFNTEEEARKHADGVCATLNPSKVVIQLQ